ncbi:hypothetical protein HGRIS_001369 [Hohenbuehelia grisea]|uniref:Uncharacterized protein n=1 Tax=Hohenbuehelia grisea TaxID=104357 RepID=A0ABR3JQ59_9AGAR
MDMDEEIPEEIPPSDELIPTRRSKHSPPQPPRKVMYHLSSPQAIDTRSHSVDSRVSSTNPFSPSFSNTPFTSPSTSRSSIRSIQFTPLQSGQGQSSKEGDTRGPSTCEDHRGLACGHNWRSIGAGNG